MSKQDANFGNKDSQKTQPLPNNFDKKSVWVRQTVTRKLEGQNVTVGAKGIGEVQCYTPEEFEDSFTEKDGVYSHRSLDFQVTILHEPSEGVDAPTELDVKKQEIEDKKDKELQELRQQLADSQAQNKQLQTDLSVKEKEIKEEAKEVEDAAKKDTQEATKTAKSSATAPKA